MQVILVFMWRSWRLYQEPGGYGSAPAGYTTTSRYRATLAAKKIAEFVKACGNGLKWANIFYQMLKKNGGGKRR